eukprot:scaffold1908_cov104-Isochrysis_galbana.AAC.1
MRVRARARVRRLMGVAGGARSHIIEVFKAEQRSLSRPATRSPPSARAHSFVTCAPAVPPLRLTRRGHQRTAGPASPIPSLSSPRPRQHPASRVTAGLFPAASVCPAPNPPAPDP